MPYFDFVITEPLKLIEYDPVLSLKPTFLYEHEIYYALSMLEPPEKFLAGNREFNRYKNYRFGSLELIDKSNNYIVKSNFSEYAQDLRNQDFQEVNYCDYSLFYYKGIE